MAEPEREYQLTAPAAAAAASAIAIAINTGICHGGAQCIKYIIQHTNNTKGRKGYHVIHSHKADALLKY